MSRNISRTSRRSSGGSGLKWFLLSLPAVFAAVYFAYLAGRDSRVQEEQPEAPRRRPISGVPADPFAGIARPDDSPRGYGRTTDDRYDSWKRLTSDLDWVLAVDEVRRANAKLEEAERLHGREDAAWRALARDAKHLLDAALDRTAELVDNLGESSMSSSRQRELRDVRHAWRQRAMDLHKTVGG